MENWDFSKIKADLTVLRSRGEGTDVFGSGKHKFVLNPPLKEAAILVFEEHHEIQLPLDYRRFLLDVGNGGVGPYYGLFKLGEMDNGYEFAPWQENDGFVGDLSEPFPFTEPWNDLCGMPNGRGLLPTELSPSLTIGDDRYTDPALLDQQQELFEKQYWLSSRVNGAIPICHLGCALRHWLVVTGSQAGNIWCDHRAELQGLFPYGATEVCFYDWYRHWLDDALNSILFE